MARYRDRSSLIVLPTKLIKTVNMKQILKRLKQGLLEGSSYKPQTILKWFLFGVSESYSVRMTNKYHHYKTLKPCGANTEDLHSCDVYEYYCCRNCELG